MSFDTSENLSAKAAEELQELGDSGDSQAFAVADCLNTIAENGGDQSTDEYLIGCAQEIITAAQRFIDEVQGFPPDHGKARNAG